MNSTTLAQSFAQFAIDTYASPLAPDIFPQTRRAFVNWVGCAFGGCEAEAVDLALRALLPHAGPPNAAIVGRSERTDILTATLINTISVSAYAFDDTHFASVAHPTAPVAAALLALSETYKISGNEFLKALAVGIEIQCRIGKMLTTAPARFPVGLSMAGYVGCIGAAVAAGLAMGFTRDKLVNAIGVATNQSAGSRENHGTTVNVFSPGHAARAGLQAALLAQVGYTGSMTAIEGPKGLAVSVASAALPEIALEGLGHSWELAGLSFKPYPNGFVIHPTLDACLEIVAKHNPAPAEIAGVSVTVHKLAKQLCDRPRPCDSHEALVSLQHWTAASLIRGRAGLAEGSTETVRDPAIVALRDKVTVVADDGFARTEGRVDVTMICGETYQAHIANCRGSALNPMSEPELRDKFISQVARLHNDPSAVDFYDTAYNVDGRGDMADFARSLSTAGAAQAT